MTKIEQETSILKIPKEDLKRIREKQLSKLKKKRKRYYSSGTRKKRKGYGFLNMCDDYFGG